MAIVKMKKLDLVAMSYEKDELLNALQRTGAVEVAVRDDTEYANVNPSDSMELRGEFLRVETALATLSKEVENYEKEHDIKTDALRDGFEVEYAEFMRIYEKKSELEEVVFKINSLTDERNLAKANLTKLKRQYEIVSTYAFLDEPFDSFKDTARTHFRLGALPTTNLGGLQKELEQEELIEIKTLREFGSLSVILAVSHKTVSLRLDSVLSSFAFADCPYSGEKSGKQMQQELRAEYNELEESILANVATMYELKAYIRPLKTYSDYLSFLLEKEETSGKLRETQTTFFLQAYLPEDAETRVREEISKSIGTCFMEFSEPTEEDNPPTLLKNNGIVSNFESITNSYSPPNYREFDPNAVMSFFYSLFMGFIIGDAGYGLLMLLIGGWLCYKNRAKPTGMSRLAGAFAVGGFFAIIWGLLFNSAFGIAALGAGNTVMPDPQKDQWLLAGISVPSVLIIAMLLGVGQLFVGYICKAVQEWRRGNIGDGICDGVLWAIFSVGVALVIVGFVEEFNMSALATVGAVIAGASLLLAIITAGRKEKFFGKFTKGFGAAYGIINYVSDILSYARLYGLMLSGAVIAQIIGNYSTQFLISGNVGLILLAVVLLVVGHGFNLVMNLLGAYIHDARLQYVEFYSRFFEGEGELFKPLGSSQKYVSVLRG
ncbi:MAG: V-type ATP synthase subunit I [Clostridia bacterium]|nr:V-type ATP synthase subunit I [Clostridia bacterium]